MIDYDYDTFREVIDTELKILNKMIDELENDKKENNDKDNN
jgi:hypothetical protein